MDTVNNNPKRIGNFTSGKLAALFSEPTAAAKKAGEIFGKAAHTYIRQKRWERRLGRSISNDTNARPLSWGSLGEKYVFENILGTEYELLADVVYVHPTIDYWSGSPDAILHGDAPKVVDLKSPETLNSFCTFYDCNTIEDVREQHADGEDYYYQLLSNAVLTNCSHAQLLIFCPYQSELAAIRKLAEHSGEYKYNWIAQNTNDNEFPFLPDGCEYNNLKVINFEVTQEMKDALTSRILAAGKLLLSKS